MADKGMSSGMDEAEADYAELRAALELFVGKLVRWVRRWPDGTSEEGYSLIAHVEYDPDGSAPTWWRNFNPPDVTIRFGPSRQYTVWAEGFHHHSLGGISTEATVVSSEEKEEV